MAEVVYKAGGICGPRDVNYFQLVILHEGYMEAEIGAKKVRVETGSAILFVPGTHDFLTFTADGSTRHGLCVVNTDCVPKPLQRLFRAAGETAKPFSLRGHQLLALAKRVEKNSASSYFYQHLALALLTDFAGEDSTCAGLHPALQKLEEAIKADYPAEIGLDELAKRAGLSPQHLLKLCREAHLPTPMEQLFTQRLEVAHSLLIHSGLAIKEISDQCGFANPYHFSRKFHQTYHLSPKAFRQAAWKATKSGDNIKSPGRRLG